MGEKNGISAKTILALLVASGGIGTTTGVIGGMQASNAVSSSEARAIAKETAMEVVRSDETTEKMKTVIHESPVIIKIQRQVEDNSKALEEIQENQRDDTKAILKAIKEKQ